MKYVFFIASTLFLSSCNNPAGNAGQALQSTVDGLQKEVKNSYRPGLGEFMLGIQTHHAKLWFAGINKNWKLANFELGEIKETIEDIKQYNSDRSEVKSIPMIEPVLDSLDQSIQNKQPESFKNNFELLTKTCNNCHLATEHEFNVITIPTAPPVTNQDFSAKK
jgi:hypothetical protein